MVKTQKFEKLIQEKTFEHFVSRSDVVDKIKSCLNSNLKEFKGLPDISNENNEFYKCFAACFSLLDTVEVIELNGNTLISLIECKVTDHLVEVISKCFQYLNNIQSFIVCSINTSKNRKQKFK